MTEDQDAKDSHSDSGGKSCSKGKEKKSKTQRPLTKIILRRLPPTMTEEQFLEQVSPIPEHDYFYFAKPDPSLGNNLYSRAYINFVNVDDIYLFRDKFDGYIFLDSKGVEYVGIVEYAPFQRIPKKKKKKDPKCGTIESDPVYQEFLENLTKEPETENQPKLEYSYPINDANEKKVQSTPLLEYLAARKQDKRGRDERRRRENDKRKMRIERKAKDLTIKEEEPTENDIKKIKSREWEKEKSSDSKEEKIKSEKDGTVFESRTYRDQRKSNNTLVDKKKKVDGDKRDDKDEDIDEKKREKIKDANRDQKSKRYSDTRKDRVKPTETGNSKQAILNKIMSSDGKSKSLNHDDIKPFTQLPQVKTDDLTKIIEDMEKKAKLENNHVESKFIKDVCNETSERKSDLTVGVSKVRKSSVESNDAQADDLDGRKDRGRSTDREGSEEKDKSDGGSERRSERRIRNKDRPSLLIYQPGMGKFSKQRLAKDKDQPAGKPINDGEKKDT